MVDLLKIVDPIVECKICEVFYATERVELIMAHKTALIPHCTRCKESAKASAMVYLAENWYLPVSDRVTYVWAKRASGDLQLFTPLFWRLGNRATFITQYEKNGAKFPHKREGEYGLFLFCKHEVSGDKKNIIIEDLRALNHNSADVWPETIPNYYPTSIYDLFLAQFNV